MEAHGEHEGSARSEDRPFSSECLDKILTGLPGRDYKAGRADTKGTRWRTT